MEHVFEFLKLIQIHIQNNSSANVAAIIIILLLLLLLLLLLNSALEYAIRKVQETSLGLDIDGAHQVLANADDVNLIGDDIRTRERNAYVLLNACKDIGLAVNTGKLSTWKYDVIEA